MGKLVRDKIPALIERNGEIPKIRILEEQEYRRCLEAKLDEEVAEFHAGQNVEELADILEVVYALAESIGCTREELLACYEKKHAERGGFQKRVFLMGKE